MIQYLLFDTSDVYTVDPSVCPSDMGIESSFEMGTINDAGEDERSNALSGTLNARLNS